MSKRNDRILTTIEEATKVANMLKRKALEQMLSDNAITKAQYDSYNQDYQFIVIQRGWFESWCSKKGFTKDEQGNYEYKFVKF